MVHLSDYRLPDYCKCNVCRKQIPSLRNICPTIDFRKDSRFQVTAYTTFEELYAVYAVELGAALLFQFLPLEYPKSVSGSGMTPLTACVTAIVSVKGHGMPKFLGNFHHSKMQFRP